MELLRWAVMAVFILMTATLMPFNLYAQSKAPEVENGERVGIRFPVKSLIVQEEKIGPGQIKPGSKGVEKADVRCRAGPP